MKTKLKVAALLGLEIGLETFPGDLK